MKLIKHKLLLLTAGLFIWSFAVAATIPAASSFSTGSGMVLAAEGVSTEELEPKEGDCSKKPLTKDNCGIVNLIVIITNIMSGIAGLVIVGMIIFGGIQYSMAGADPSKVQAARHKITSALTALVLFVFGYALLQWLVPGGLL